MLLITIRIVVVLQDGDPNINLHLPLSLVNNTIPNEANIFGEDTAVRWMRPPNWEGGARFPSAILTDVPSKTQNWTLVLPQRRFCPLGPNGANLGQYSRVTFRILYVSAKWSRRWRDVAATKTRSRRVYPHGIGSPPEISRCKSASRWRRSSKCLAKLCKMKAIGDVAKCSVGWIEI